MKAYVEPEWSQINNRLETFELEDEDIASDGENSNKNQTQEVDEDREDNDDFDDNLFCVACNKAFKSSKSYENHGKSKKHKENVELLKKHMKEEDEHLFASLNKNESAQEPEQTKQK
jgi:DnaJ family protein A protein 5